MPPKVWAAVKYFTLWCVYKQICTLLLLLYICTGRFIRFWLPAWQVSLHMLKLLACMIVDFRLRFESRNADLQTGAKLLASLILPWAGARQTSETARPECGCLNMRVLALLTLNWSSLNTYRLYYTQFAADCSLPVCALCSQYQSMLKNLANCLHGEMMIISRSCFQTLRTSKASRQSYSTKSPQCKVRYCTGQYFFESFKLHSLSASNAFSVSLIMFVFQLASRSFLGRLYETCSFHNNADPGHMSDEAKKCQGNSIHVLSRPQITMKV